MRHQLTQSFDSANMPILVCDVCGAVFAARTPLDLVDASRCIDGIIWTVSYDFAPTASDPSSYGSWETGKGWEYDEPLSITPRPKPYEDCETKGTRLLDEWEKGADEMIDATVYYIPFGGKTLVLMGMFARSDEVALRLGIVDIPVPEETRIHPLPDTYAFTRWEIEVSPVMKWEHLSDLTSPQKLYTDFSRCRVKFGNTERIRSHQRIAGIPSLLFQRFDHKGWYDRLCLSILVEMSSDTIGCKTPLMEIEACHAIEAFFTPHVLDWHSFYERYEKTGR